MHPFAFTSDYPEFGITFTLHYMWFQGFGFPRGSDYLPNIENWARLNPGFDICKWDCNSMKEHIIKWNNIYLFETGEDLKLLEEWIKLLDRPDTPSAGLIKAIDFFRFVVAYFIGGVSLDVDFVPVGKSLWNFFKADQIYSPKVTGVPFIVPNSMVKLSKPMLWHKTILCKEYKPVDKIGEPVANGFMMNAPRQKWILNFIKQQMKLPTTHKVLDTYGPHALKRFFIDYWNTDPNGYRNERILTLHPTYFIYETNYLSSDKIPDHTICLHPEKKTYSWGDHTKKDWWNI